MARPEAVLITPAMPSDRGNGLAMRAGLLLDGLARSFAVKVLVAPVFTDMGAPTEHASRLAGEIRSLQLAPATDPAQDVIRRLQVPGGPDRVNAVHPLPSLSQGASAAAAENTAEEVAHAELVLVHRAYLLPLLDALLGRANRPPIVLDVDDIESVVHRQLGQPAEAERFERLEAHYLPLLDAIVTCSRADAELLRDRVELNARAVIPNAIHMPSNLARTRKGDHGLLLVGNLSYEPNVEAATWLCHEVLQLLGDDVKLAVVGNRPAPAVQALGTDARVTLAPDVGDVTPWYARSSVAVVPVLRGGGSRIKLIEALAHRRPVVATSLGAAGTPWSREESPVVLADTPADFAQACRDLIDNPDRARKLAMEGERFVRERASVDVVAPQIDRLALSMVGR